MLSPFMIQRLLVALEGTPDVLNGLLGSLDAHDPAWDFQPDPERFTLREIIAHLADYEPVWLDRFEHTRKADGIRIERLDPSKLAVDNDYPHSDPIANLSLFRQRRAIIVDLIKTFKEEDWDKVAILPQPAGPLSLGLQSMYLSVHDAYHTGQVAQWLALWARTSGGQ